MSVSERLLTVNEVAEWLNVSLSQCYKLLARKDLHSYRVGKARRISREQVLEYLERDEDEKPKHIRRSFL